MTWLVDVSESTFRSVHLLLRAFASYVEYKFYYLKVLLFESFIICFLIKHIFNDFRRHLYPFDCNKILMRRINYKIYIRVDYTNSI